ncbi:hypothetical protein AN217_20570 [Streptomyces qinglanensis]|uniref:Uncharacterized protein n=2 Tax=Streptomyces TaxID=1883 RepID=A0A1E7K7J2_9ACTN|nr:hypothetical protein [Streptomyces qinglanensis]OEU99806.1 hypothetical protein AN217_20570 [Streptomyces qinglanensis]OEV25501.1 hypothetical protein AN220_13435 [Streptomyces nanshensis]
MSTGNYRANPQRARMVAEKLRSLAERPQQIQDEMAGHFAYYDRWKGRPDAVADSFYRDAKKTEDEWKESLLEQTGLQGATFGVVAATLTVANSAEGTEGFADDIVQDARKQSEEALEDIDSDDTGHVDGGSGESGGGRH